MNDEPSLLRAIHEQPADDARRLAYADWLAGRDEPRGEFIRAQCRLAQKEDDPIAYERARSLWNAHGERWLAELPMWIERDHWEIAFRRGFADVIVVRDPEVFWAHWSDIAGMTQVPLVIVPGAIGGEVDHFAISPDARRIAQLHRIETGAFDWQGAVESLSIFDADSRVLVRTSETVIDDHRLVGVSRPCEVRFSADGSEVVIRRLG